MTEDHPQNILLKFLKNYPDYDDIDYKKIISNPKTKKIVQKILDENFEELQIRDFEIIKEDGDFFRKCGNYLQIYGIDIKNINLIKFSIKLFESSRKYLKKFSHDYGLTLLMEGTSASFLGTLSNDIENDYKKSIELFKQSRKLGLKKEKEDYGISLLNESSSRLNMAKLNIEKFNNLKKSIRLITEAKKYFENDELYYTQALILESSVRLQLVFAGNYVENDISNQEVVKTDLEKIELKKVIELCEEARSIGISPNLSHYANSLTNEFFAISNLELYDEKNLRKIAEIGELLRKNVFNSYNYQHEIFLTSESNARLKLYEIGINKTENLNKAIIVLEILNDVIDKKNPHYKLNLSREIQFREKISNKNSNEKNLKRLILLYERLSELLNKKSSEYLHLKENECTIVNRLISIHPSNENLINAISFYKKARKEILKPGSKIYISSLNGESIALQKLVELGYSTIEESNKNLKDSIELCQKIRNYEKSKKTPQYLISFLEEGSSRSKLALFGTNPIDELKKAICLFELARFGFKKNNNSYGYALSLMDESITRMELAKLKIDPVNNLQKSIKFSKRARREGLKKGSEYYISTMINQSAATMELAKYGNIGDEIDALENISRLFSDSRMDFKKGSKEYAYSLIEEGKVITNLTEFGIGSTEELMNVRDNYIKARSIIGIKTPEYVTSLVEEGITLQIIAEKQQDIFDIIGSLNQSISLFQESRELGLLENTPYYASSLIYEGISRVKLASKGIQKKQNLISAVQIYKKAKNEEIVRNASVTNEKINYGRILLIEGETRFKLVKLNINKEHNSIETKSLYLEAITILKKSNDRIGLIKAYTNLGNLYSSENKIKLAYINLKKAIKLIEDTRSSIKIPEIRKEYFGAFIQAYNAIIFICIALGKNKEAFEYAEASKGREFLELLSNDKMEIKGDPILLEEYKAISDQIDKIDHTINELELEYNQNEEIDYDYAIDINSRISTLIEKQKKVLYEIKRNNPEYYSINPLNPIDIEDICLKGKTLIEYVLGDKLAIFVLNKDNLIVKEVEISFDEVFDQFILFRKIIENGTDLTEAKNILKYFYEILIEPVKENLNEEIIIITDKILSAIPFQALKGDKYLIEEYKISFAQSAASLKYINPGTGSGSLIIGNPTSDLPESEIEAIEIAKILGTKAIIKDDAKKSVFLQGIPNKKIIHIACHGSFNLMNPSLSNLKLSDGYIRIMDLMELNINSDLMVLSACDSGLSDINYTNEFEGLIRSIQLGGSRFVIASLWKVEDKSTKELFLKFYYGTGNAIERLRNAELDLMKQYDFDKWSAFQIYGI